MPPRPIYGGNRMLLAKNNIIIKIQNNQQPNYAILNPVSGSFDLMDESEYDILQGIADGESLDADFKAYLLERGYAFESKEAHDAAIEQAYTAFNDEIEKSPVQLMLVPTYGCNLACTYCYQGRGTDSAQSVPVNMDSRPSLIAKEIVDAFFDYARIHFSQSPIKPFITLFGGEPLINSPAQRNIVSYILDRCAEENLEFSAVTNGVDFPEYVDLLKKVRVKEIQFTLDGSKNVHDSRRATANKKGTFDRVVAGIEAAVNNKLPVNLRSVVDMENIRDLVHLAEFLDKKGWLDLPPELFKTQIGRNYELFDCYAKPQHLMSQVELWGEFAVLSKTYPILAKFHRPDFKGIRHLVDTGEMYMATFDTCPACKTEWVFDLFGNMYGCTASCGREEYLLGTFWPAVMLNNEAIETWQKRDVKSIPKCRDCKYDVVCGGGCGVVAANQHAGNILSPDCRPIQELMETGVNHYIDEINDLIEDVCVKSKRVVLHKPAKKPSVSCCSPKKTEGCLLCGQELIYSNDTASEETCNICVKQFDTFVKCSQGHFVCDSCHSPDILGKIEQLLTASAEMDPVTLAQKVFELPGLNMHGPEYHSIVPAVLVAAWQNQAGKKDVCKIQEALRRGKDIKGGACGFYGNCGAAVGAGTAISIIESVTPLSRDERGAANRATGFALLEIGKYGGPRCCKREAITSIESFIQTTGYFSRLQKTAYICKQFGKNTDCIHQKCPYFPKG